MINNESNRTDTISALICKLDYHKEYALAQYYILLQLSKHTVGKVSRLMYEIIT